MYQTFIKLGRLWLVSQAVIFGTACTQIETHASYAAMSLTQRMQQADAIVEGVVTDISPVRWNQDSGEYWEDTDANGETVDRALAYYTIEVTPLQHIVSDAGVRDTLTLTVIATGPIDVEAVTATAGHADSLQVGNEVFVMARKTDLAWRGGTRRIWQLLGMPKESYYVRDGDGLYKFGAKLSDPGVSVHTLTAQTLKARAGVE